MKLKELKEMAIIYPKGFDITPEKWEIFANEQTKAEHLKQLHDNVELRRLIKDSTTTYTLWIDGAPVAGAILEPKVVHGKSYQFISSVFSDPKQNKKGYATSLIWELYLALKEKLLIGGAVSPKGAAFLSKFLKHYETSQPGKTPKVIDDETGEISNYDPDRFISDHHLFLILECWPLKASLCEFAGEQMWLFNENTFAD